MNRLLKALLFVATALPLAAVELAVLLTGWLLVGLLVVTPLIVPALLGFRWAVGALARLEAALARRLLDVDVEPVTASGGRGFWGRGWAVVVDASFWRQQVYLSLRTVVGFGLGVCELSLLGSAAYLIFLPIYWRWVETDVGVWRIDSLGAAFLAVPVGIAGLAVALLLLRPLAAVWRTLARGLLRGEGPALDAAERRALRRRALVVHALAVAAIDALLLVVWAATWTGYFWPIWPLLGLGLPLAAHAWVELVEERPQLWRRFRLTKAFAVHAGLSVAVELFLVAVWAVTGARYPWPFWTLLGLAIPVAAHGFVARRGELAARIATLETSRAGAVDVQDEELRRIERDLHDGAQARLVALGMNLGMAEQKLHADPAAALGLVTEARAGVEQALRELRDLARGIHPPVLADRGLGAAIAALADGSAVPVTLDVAVDERPAPAVETAAYFVVAEALAPASSGCAAGWRRSTAR